MVTTKEQKMTFRCFAYPGENNGEQGYYAVCIDLNLHTWRPVAKDARRSLNDAILGYIETAVEVSENEHEFNKMLQRPAPLFPYQIKYYYYLLVKKMVKEISTAFHDDGTAYDNSVKIFPNGTVAA